MGSQNASQTTFFCVDCNVPARTVTCYANNKPWITKDIKAILNEKRRAFRKGNCDEVRRVQGVLKLKIREAKDNYRRKLGNKLKQNLMFVFCIVSEYLEKRF